jgi:3-deoxy-7-phosphoheptulonate synthase/chorismate mutase
MDDLKEIRSKIDDVNRQLLECLNERAKLVQKAGAVKAKSNQPLVDLPREHEMLEQVLDRNTGPFSKDAIAKIFREIFVQSHTLFKQPDTQSTD